jgi:hypothetical protein
MANSLSGGGENEIITFHAVFRIKILSTPLHDCNKYPGGLSSINFFSCLSSRLKHIPGPLWVMST